MIPFSHGLVTFMKDMRRDEEPLCTTMMLEYIKKNHRHWFNNYVAGKKNIVSADNAIMRLLQRFSKRHGFTVQAAQHTKKTSADLEETDVKFAIEFLDKYEHVHSLSTIYNVDETAIYYDTPPNYILAERGRKGSAKVKYTEKHSVRLTAVMTVRADSKRCPILFIVKGVPGGSIETTELPTYPQGQGHVYCVQENGWMDSRV
ncbi:Dimodular nonribosomal peptide synthase [Phytophthora cinnamomi]|uniref:Dimodular nonribosomal peptide synthase n=1 Tax=Phytophthora cinnamomi TaxID=4785 RepID=UPI00355ABE6C|nr:Dimodular nonribosomal peptide synthase [Phytophthora cinnamomi]